MKTYNYSVEQNSYTEKKGTLQASSKKEAEIQAVLKFLDHNDIPREDETDAELIQYYGPCVKLAK